MDHARTINLEDVSLSVSISGTGKPVLILGGPWFGQYYLRQLKEVLASHFRVIGYDPRGSGHSSPLTQGEITLSGHLRDLEGLRKSLDVEKINLVGHSIGALVGLLYAAHHPDTMASLTLMHPGPPFAEDQQRQLHSAYVSAFTPEDRARMKQISSSTPFQNSDPRTHEDFFRVLYSPFFTDRSLMSKVDFAFTPTTAKYAAHAEEALFPQIIAADPVARLRNVRCPTLVVHAEQDIIPEAFSRSLAQGIPDAKYTVLRGVGHFSYVEDPTLAAHPIIDFLKKAAQ